MSASLALVPLEPFAPTPQDYIGRPNRREAFRLANAFMEGAHLALRSYFERAFGRYSNLSYAAVRSQTPTYEQVRDFLMWDNQCDFLIAQEVAMRVTSREGRYS